MFVANTLTVWVEALQQVFGETHPHPELRSIPVTTDYPQQEVDYPGIWVNFSMQGDVRNAGIGHVEHVEDTEGGIHYGLRWMFGGVIEITVGAMSNLERALLLDEISRTIAVARVDLNQEGVLRAHVERNDLIGMIVTWESFTISGFGEAQGTPWGTDDVIYEATISLALSGEVVLDPQTGTLVPLSEVRLLDPALEGEPGLPVPGVDGWR